MRIGAALPLISALLLVGCARSVPAEDGAADGTMRVAAPEEANAALYVNRRLGFAMELPLDRLGQIEVEENYDVPLQGGWSRVTVCHRQTLNQGGCSVLFFIDVYEGDRSAENPPVQAGGGTIVLKANDCTYLPRTPSDVQFCAENEELTRPYQALGARPGGLAGRFGAVS